MTLDRGLDTRGLTPLADRLGAGAVDLSWFLTTAQQLCLRLAEQHRRNLIYGRLSPASVVASATGQEVRLLEPSPDWRPRLDEYMSPEQTGRMNRAVDHRSDFYSLGATLYALLTGLPPFRSADRLELIHGHIARTPASPTACDARVPEQVSRIVMKLMAKSPDNRYQSALGVRNDLAACERDWRSRQSITLFDPGLNDVPERLVMPQRLFGRDRELAILRDAFTRTCTGETSLVLVSGYSGIGKTSLIGEFYKPMIRQHGYFVTGKFDQVARNIPYGAVIQAFRALVWQLLTESEDRVAESRRRLLEALGTNGGVLTEVIPEVEFLIGSQPAPPPLDPAEAQNRFRYAFQSFVGSVARAASPLIVFLDDLQWVDVATLELLHTIITAPDVAHLLVIGAYRENEVDAGHILTAATGRLQASGAPVRTVALDPLSADEVVAFISHTLRCGGAEPTALAELILEKTAGNPFFVIQFLESLQRDGLLRFDTAHGAWVFDMNAVAAAGMTDNVIDLMTRRMRRLSTTSQTVLTLAACIGSRFTWTTLLTVSPLGDEGTAAGLTEALAAGLVEDAAPEYERPDQAAGAGAAYRFLHDRVQQAAYDLIPPERKARVHLEVGRLLVAECGDDVPEDRLFETVNHLNIGGALLSGGDERLSVARLNLAAARKAKTSTAYEAACGYLEQGIALLGDEHWASDYDLMFALRLDAAECQYLAGRFEAAEAYFELLLARGVAPLDRVQVHSLRIVLYENLSRYGDALDSAREALAQFGIAFPDDDATAGAAVEAEIEVIEQLRGGRTIASLVTLPEMADRPLETVMRILTLMWAGAYISGHHGTARLISARMIRLTLAHGVTADSAYGCVTHAITMGPVRKDYAAAYDWGALALALNDRFGDTRYRAKIHQQFHAHVNLWRRPFATCIPHAREARRSGLESGDFTYAGYGTVTEAWPAFMISRSLSEFVRAHTPDLALLERIRMEDFRGALQVLLNWAQALQGRTADALSLSTADFDEHAFVARHEASAPFFLTFLYTAKLHLCVLFGRFAEGVAFERLARAVTPVGTMWPVLLDFWGSLAITGAWPGFSNLEREQQWPRLEAARDSLRELADNCPENFRCFWLIVSAEIARIGGSPDEAFGLFDQAIAYSRQTDHLQHEAIAHELYARMKAEAQDYAAAVTLGEAARRAYAEWGAEAKVAHLDAQTGRPAPLAAERVGSPPASAARGEPALDMETVLKLARAVSGEIELKSLVPRLMKLALENAGAGRALFIREHEGRLVTEAEALADSGQISVRDEASASATFAHSVVWYVRRTGQDVVVGNAARDERFAADPYIVDNPSTSILGVPVVHQGKTDGILYLENSLTSDAFTAERTEVMRILAAQAAIALENARLYDGLKDEVARRSAAERSLRDALAELEVLKNRLEAENVYLQEEIRTQHNFNEIVGNAPSLLDVLRRVELVAPTESTVLILGETGSGKELFARAVHSRSRRSGRPLVKVNCGAIAPGLVESELFGHVKGAFTGAIEKRVGRFEVANGGTILLDEVGELPLDAQVKLLRVLQEQEFEPVGSSRTVHVDVRVIAATNRDLELAVREGRFRADLLYRLNVFPIAIPPLRRRREDIPSLVSLFVSTLARRLGKPLRGFSPRSMERLMAYAWPGNVRELQNVVERAAILASGPVLDVESTFMDLSRDAAERPSTGTLDNVQRQHIQAVLATTGGVVEGTRGAAAILGLHPNTLRSRMRKLGITASRATPQA